jgi:hypothetical protein
MPPACLPRSPANLAAVIDSLQVEKSLKYQPEVFGDAKRTKCNWYLEDLCALLSVHIPKGLLARQQIQWLNSPASRDAGWYEVLRPEADKLADQGMPVVVGWVNPEVKKSSHVALMRAAGRITQAGASNFADGSIMKGFGPRAVNYWAHL